MTDQEPSHNVARYWRKTDRHNWQRGGTTVNVRGPRDVVVVSRTPGGITEVDVPYDPAVWSPPKSTKRLPGLHPSALD